MHELRHIWWNIIDPGKDVVDGYRLRLKNNQPIPEEEKDCEDVEKAYKDFVIFTP